MLAHHRLPRPTIILAIVAGIALSAALGALAPTQARADYFGKKHYEAELEDNKAGRQDLTDSPLGQIDFTMTQFAYYGHPTQKDAAGWAYTPVWRVDGDRGLLYCANHDRYSPQNTSYKARELYVDNQRFEADDLKAVLYFGYGGPGFQRNLFPSKNYDGGSVDDQDLFAWTHLMIHYVYTGDWESAKKGQEKDFLDWAKQRLIDDGGTLSIIRKMKGEVPSDFKAFLLDSEWDGRYQQLIGFIAPDHVEVRKLGIHSNPLDGATFAVYSDAACTKEACRMTTDASGIARSKDLPQGTYYVKEVAAPTGYDLNKTVYQAEVGKTGTSRFVVKDLCHGAPASVVAQKVDAETGLASPLGGASLAGARFEVRCWAGATDASVVRSAKPTLRWIVETDEAGVAKLKEGGALPGSDHLVLDFMGRPLLPPGVVSVREVQAPAGYLASSYEQTGIVTLAPGSKHQYVCPLLADAEHQTKEQVCRGDLSLTKRDADTKAAIARIPFLVTSKTTGEAHVVVTDVDGVIDTSRGRTSSANANDQALSSGKADDAKLDPAAGVWFSGTTATSTSAHDGAHGAFPYDSYDAVELRCAANRGHTLASFSFDIREDGATVALGDVYDYPKKLETAAGCDGQQMAPPKKGLVITDSVSYENLEPGHAYVLKGSIHLRGADGSDQGVLPGSEEVETSLAPTAPSGSIDMPFTIDASSLAGRTLVVFERLEEEGEVVCSHEDIGSEGQSIHITKLATHAADKADGDQEIVGRAGETIVDAVEYENLLAGEEYELETEVHIREGDGSDGGIARDGGSDLVSRTSFTAREGSGSQAVEIPIDASGLPGKDLVIFERLYHKGTLVAAHEDIGDANQTVHVAPAPIETGVKQGLPQTGEVAGISGAMALLGASSLLASWACRHRPRSRRRSRRRRH